MRQVEGPDGLQSHGLGSASSSNAGFAGEADDELAGAC